MPRGTVSLSTRPIAVPTDLQQRIRRVAEGLWDGGDTLPASLDEKERSNTISFGEAPFPGKDYSKRAEYFRTLAEEGDPCSQHSLALLLWSGFHSPRDERASAQWHAAAAAQNHLDSMAVLGGCLRKGVGVTRNVALGLELVEYSASRMNPTGINKKAALEESNGNYEVAFDLYSSSEENPNALLLMNLGWCYVYGEGTRKDVSRGETLWKRAADMAPDEGSEEAAWLLYRQFVRDDPKEAKFWLNVAFELGHDEALEEMVEIS